MTELLSTEEAAKRLGLTAGTLMVWRSTRRYALKFIKVGRRVRYRQSDLDDFLQARTMSGTNELHVSGRRRLLGTKGRANKGAV